MTDPDGPLGELMRAVAAHWRSLLDALGPADRERLVDLVNGAGERDPRTVLVGIENLIMESGLPIDDPLMQVFLGSVRNRGTVEADLDVGSALEWLAGQLSPEFVAAVSGPTEPVTRETVLRRLAVTPSYRGDEVDGAPPELIRLRGRLPRFQFGEDRRPRRVVLEVNRILDAEHDPWGVTSWWLEMHTWLGVPPAELLGGTPGDQRRLTVAAAAAVAD